MCHSGRAAWRAERSSRRPSSSTHPSSTGPTTCGMTSPARCRMHVVAGADVLAADVVLVVQRGALDRDPADEHRLQHGERRQHAGAPHVDLDAVQARGHGRRRELEGDRPARVVGHAAQRRLESVAIDFDHGAVDVVVELVAALLPGAAGRGQRRRCRRPRRCAGSRGSPAPAATPGRCGGRAGRGPRCSRSRSTTGRAAADAASFGSSWRMEPAAALRGFTNGLQAVRAARLVEAREGGQRQIDLAAHLHDRRRSCAAQAQRAASRWCAGWR